MRNEPWVWPEVRDAGTSGAGAVPLRSAQLMGQQKKKKITVYWLSFCSLIKVITIKIHMFCFVLINSIVLKLLCIWILFYNASSHSHFRFLLLLNMQ